MCMVGVLSCGEFRQNWFLIWKYDKRCETPLLLFLILTGPTWGRFCPKIMKMLPIFISKRFSLYKCNAFFLSIRIIWEKKIFRGKSWCGRFYPKLIREWAVMGWIPLHAHFEFDVIHCFIVVQKGLRHF